MLSKPCKYERIMYPKTSFIRGHAKNWNMFLSMLDSDSFNAFFSQRCLAEELFSIFSLHEQVSRWCASQSHISPWLLAASVCCRMPFGNHFFSTFDVPRYYCIYRCCLQHFDIFGTLNTIILQLLKHYLCDDETCDGLVLKELVCYVFKLSLPAFSSFICIVSLIGCGG